MCRKKTTFVVNVPNVKGKAVTGNQLIKIARKRVKTKNTKVSK